MQVNYKHEIRDQLSSIGRGGFVSQIDFLLHGMSDDSVAEVTMADPT